MRRILGYIVAVTGGLYLLATAILFLGNMFRVIDVSIIQDWGMYAVMIVGVLPGVGLVQLGLWLSDNM